MRVYFLYYNSYLQPFKYDFSLKPLPCDILPAVKIKAIHTYKRIDTRYKYRQLFLGNFIGWIKNTQYSIKSTQASW
jgi:hypothetical protein